MTHGKDEMNRSVATAVILTFLGCGTTGPSEYVRDDLIVIDCVSGSIASTHDASIGYFSSDMEISSDGSFLYILSPWKVVRFDTAEMTPYAELDLPAQPVMSTSSSAISGNDSLLFVVTFSLNPMVYRITTADMSIADSIPAGSAPAFYRIETRPGTDLLYLVPDGEPLRILDTRLMEFTDTLQVYSDNGVFFPDSGDEMYICSGASVYACDPDTGELLRSRSFPGEIRLMQAPRGGSSIFIRWSTGYGGSPGHTLVELDRTSFGVLDTQENSCEAELLCFAEQLSRLFIYPDREWEYSIMAMDMPGFQPVGEIDIGHDVSTMILSPASDRLFCHVFFDSDPDFD